MVSRGMRASLGLTVLLAASAQAFFGLWGPQTSSPFDLFFGGPTTYATTPAPRHGGPGGQGGHGGHGGGGAGGGGGFFGSMGMLGLMNGDFGGSIGEGMKNMYNMRYDCQMDRGYCIDLYYTPAAPGAGPTEEPGEVEVEGTTAPPRKPKPGPGGPKTGPGAKPGPPGQAGKPPGPGAPPRRPPPPRRIMRPNPMAYVQSQCVSWDYDYFSCPRTGGICCYNA